MICNGGCGGRGMAGSELATAWENLTSSVGQKVSTEARKVEIGLTVAAYASVGALIFAAWAAWNTRRRT